MTSIPHWDYINSPLDWIHLMVNHSHNTMRRSVRCLTSTAIRIPVSMVTGSTFSDPAQCSFPDRLRPPWRTWRPALHNHVSERLWSLVSVWSPRDCQSWGLCMRPWSTGYRARRPVLRGPSMSRQVVVEAARGGPDRDRWTPIQRDHCRCSL